MSRQASGEDLPIFSEGLSSLLEDMVKGRSPKAGRFCGYCYTPMERRRRRCSHCGRSTAEWAPCRRVPDEVMQMFRRMRRRESIVVNGFALAGLALAVALFAILFALFEPVWWRILSLVLLVVTARGLAGFLGGFIGDHIGYRYARRRLIEEWSAFQERKRAEASPTPADADGPPALL